MLLISLTLKEVIREGAKIISMPMKDNKNRIFAEKEKTNAHRLTRKAYQFRNSRQICGTMGPTSHQQKLTAIPGDKNWKRIKNNVGNVTLAPSENST